MQYVVAILVGLVLAEVATLITTIYLPRPLAQVHPAPSGHDHVHALPGPGCSRASRLGSGWLSTANTTTSATSKAAAQPPHRGSTGRSCSPTSTTTAARRTTAIPCRKYASDLPFDRLDKVLLRRGTSGFFLTGVILVLIMGLGPGLVALATLAVVYLVLNAAINGAGHTFVQELRE